MIGRADTKNRPAIFTWDEINSFARNMGLDDFTYDSFKMNYDADPVIQALTHRFDQNGVELASKKTKTDTAPSDADPERSSVGQAAKRATNRARG